MNLTFFGGVNEIGGNKILIEEKDTRILLDFGMSFNLYKKYYAEFLQPRKCNALFDYIEFGLLPKIEGIYREDYLLYCGLKYPNKPLVDALFLSHAHLDHSAFLHFLRLDIPIYCTEETYLILKALEETSARPFMDLVNLKKDFYFIKTQKGNYKRLEGDDAKIERDFVIMKPFKKYYVGGIEVEAVPVDHSLPGAVGFMVYTNSGNVAYTGDLRFHGRRKELSREFVKVAKKADLELMLCEGTRVDEKENVTEEDVEEKSKNIILETHGHVVVNYPIRDLDRLLTFFEVAKDVDRKLVVNLKQAFLLKIFEKFGIYPKLKEVVVYIPRKGWGLQSDEFFVYLEEGGWVNASKTGKDEIMKDYDKWEREFLELENRITYKEIRDNPKDYIFRCDNFELKELIDIKPKNGVYIRSLTEPFDEDMIIEEKRVKNWLEHFNLLPMHHIHSSGHLNGKEISEIINEIMPRKLIPIHTKNPGGFERIVDRDIKIEYAKLKYE
ncbi:MAG: MBL fold metallo-hydrolase [Candidatus Aenigmatarchaeota archaeon]